MSLKIIFLGLFIGCLIGSCKYSVDYKFLSAGEIDEIRNDTQRKKAGRQACCNDWESYIPDSNYLDEIWMKQIRIAIHLVDRTDTCCNFKPEESEKWIGGYLYTIQEHLKRNTKMYLPIGNETPVKPIAYRYVLQEKPNGEKGIYHHFDDDLFYFIHKGRYRNNYNRDVINKYRNGGDSVINAFFLPHHPDSLLQRNYRAAVTGIALGRDVKLAGVIENGTHWQTRGLFDHEIGHVLGLSHSWRYNDGCDDTPKHPNCWTYGSPPCDSNVSNNVMDYNTWQRAFTPCQIGKVHRSFSKLGSVQRDLLVRTWCQLDSLKDIVISDSVVWEGARDLKNSIHITSGGFLHVKCRVSMPPNSEIQIDPGGTLFLDEAHLHNDCNQSWKGIMIGDDGKSKGRVVAKIPYLIENNTSFVAKD